MTVDASDKTRLGWRRIAVIILLGPLVGALTLAVFSLFFPSSGGAADAGGRVLFLVVIGYGLGLVPASMAAVVYALLYRWLRRWAFLPLLVACLVIGGACGGIGVGVSLLALDHPLTMGPALMATGAWAGAAALAFTALPFRKRVR